MFGLGYVARVCFRVGFKVCFKMLRTMCRGMFQLCFGYVSWASGS